MKSFTEKRLPFRENPETLVILIDDKDCPASENNIAGIVKCGNDLAVKNGYPGAQITGGIFGTCVGGDGCQGILGYTEPGSGWFVTGYDMCVIATCPSDKDSTVVPHEIGHNFNLCEGYCYSGGGQGMCYREEKLSFGGFCGTSRIEQKFPNTISASSRGSCGGCGPSVCCEGRLLTGDTVNPFSGGRDVMGPGGVTGTREFACDSYLAFKDVAVSVYGFDLPPVTDLEIQNCYNHIKGDTYP